MKRRQFIHHSALLGAALAIPELGLGRLRNDFPIVRVPLSQRNFSSNAIEKAIRTFKSAVADKELCWLFENCFPNTVDTTVTFKMTDNRPDTYIITGDIDAMWMRDSSAQVWPYLQFVNEDKALKNLIAGVINRQTKYILKDPYANAFYFDENRIGEWKNDRTAMKPGVHERKWEIDSLCYPIRLAYNYWKKTNDTAPFDANWKAAIRSTLETFTTEQRRNGRSPYRFQRDSPHPTDSQPMGGTGFPTNPVGLICSAFRPSDDSTVFPFLIPSNFFAVVSLRQAAEMIQFIQPDVDLQKALVSLANEVEIALQKYSVVERAEFGKMYAFEIDGFGSQYLMDDSNVPSLLSMPYLGAISATNPIYQNTRKFALSENNPYFYKGKAGEGIGGPHVGANMIWPMSIIMRGLTSDSDIEIRNCIKMLKATHGGKGFMHEAFHKDNPEKFTRSWFAWANTLFGEFIWKTFNERPHLLQ